MCALRLILIGLTSIKSVAERFHYAIENGAHAAKQSTCETLIQSIKTTVKDGNGRLRYLRHGCFDPFEIHVEIHHDVSISNQSQRARIHVHIQQLTLHRLISYPIDSCFDHLHERRSEINLSFSFDQITWIESTQIPIHLRCV